MTAPPPFNEAQWLKLLFLLADTQSWIDDLCRQAFAELPLGDKKKCLRKTYYLTAPALAHIVERHYYKISRHPDAGKFLVPVTDIVAFIRDASQVPALPVPGTLNSFRTLQTTTNIGIDRNGNPADNITVITDAGGKIITAFPGNL
jgi:hypothetical protein